ncbi:MAG: acetate uptake transporter, partial [Candidatus Dormibacteria bacterium]
MATMETTGRSLSGAVPAAAAEGAGTAAVTIADPAPLGLAAFALTTMVLSAINVGWIGAIDEPVVLGLAVAYGGTAQLLAGMWAFRRGNTFAATAFSSYGAFWLSFWLIVQYYAPMVAANTAKALGPGATTAQITAATVDHLNTILGLYLFMWGVFTAYMLIASLAGAKAVQVVFLLLTLTFFALAIGKWNNSTDFTHIGGFIGILTAVAAFYTSFADVVNANFKR